MFKKKIFSLTLLIVLSLGFFYSPVVLAQSGDAPAETIQDCFTKAQTERQDCYGTNTPETLAACDINFEAAQLECSKIKDGSYSPSNIGGLINPLSGTTVPGFLGNIIGAVLGVVGSLALILFIYAGFQWMTARGNPEQVKSATKTMMWAALGLLMIFSSYMIVKFIFNAFGITEK